MPNMLDIESRFSKSPIANVPRSVIPRKSDLKTTFNYGQLIPIYVDEILPADSKKMSVGSLVRMSTPMFPVMDSSYMDLYAFFVPNRLIWSHWEEFMGENKDSAWVSDKEYSIPVLDSNAWAVAGVTGMEEGSIFDYFGLPTGVAIPDDTNISALPLRAYNLIWNEWFRDENLQNPIPLNTGDDDSSNSYSVLVANKLHDYFTSALPAPQKGDSVSLVFNGGISPVYVMDRPVTLDHFSNLVTDHSDNNNRLTFLIGAHGSASGEPYPFTNAPLILGGNNTANTGISGGGNTFTGSVVQASTDVDSSGSGFNIYGLNLYTDLNRATVSTINQLRLAVATQQYLEKLARGGSRYTEIIRQMFGVVSPDARLQRPELLGHIRLNIEMNQVIQTSFEGGTVDTTPLGSTGAYSKTTGYNYMFDKSFVEHGYLIILACARTELTYQQGLEKMWTRRSVLDFYNPTFANIGEQPIYKKELYFQNNKSVNDSVFGYQEAWAEYRYKQNKVTGAFRSNAAQPLDAWHYAQEFTSLPVLGSDFIRQDGAVVDRTLAVQDGPELLCNFFFDEVATRPMPVYSIPGLDVL